MSQEPLPLFLGVKPTNGLTGRPLYFRPKNRFLWHPLFVVVLLAHWQCNTRVLCRIRRGIAWHACSLLPEAAWAHHVQKTILGVGKWLHGGLSCCCSLFKAGLCEHQPCLLPGCGCVVLCSDVVNGEDVLSTPQGANRCCVLYWYPTLYPRAQTHTVIAKTQSLPAVTRCNRPHKRSCTGREGPHLHNQVEGVLGDVAAQVALPRGHFVPQCPCSTGSPLISPSPCPHGRWCTTDRCCWRCSLHGTWHNPRRGESLATPRIATRALATWPRDLCSAHCLPSHHVQMPKSPVHPWFTVSHCDCEL